MVAVAVAAVIVDFVQILLSRRAGFEDEPFFVRRTNLLALH